MKALNKISKLLFSLVVMTAVVLGVTSFSDGYGMILAGPALMVKIEPQLLQQFDNLKEDFLTPIKSKDEYVNFDVIKLNDIGADPDVLIDNLIYPIATAGRTDQEVVISLRKLDTENTKVTDDEIQALPYDKKSSVRERHIIALKKKSLKLGLYSLAPAGDTTNTPVIVTTGATIGGRKRLKLPDDLVTLKGRFDALNIDMEDRYICLCSEHVEDMLLSSQTFEKQYHLIKEGKVLDMYGFKMFENQNANRYNGDTLAKVAFEAAALSSDRNASTAYYAPNAVKAKGSIKVYLRDAAQDPENRESVLGMRLYYLVIPVKNVGFGAVVSAKV